MRVKPMPKTDAYEQEVIAAFEEGRLKSVASKAELAKFKAAARATAIKDRRVNIRLSSGDLGDIQVRALEGRSVSNAHHQCLAQVRHRSF
jgi:predicted DNA binding CopG/RHH family protein